MSSDPVTCSKRYFRASAAVSSVSWAIEKWSLGHFRLPVLNGLMACFGTALARSGLQRSGSNTALSSKDFPSRWIAYGL